LTNAACPKDEPGIELIKRMQRQHAPTAAGIVLTKEVRFTDGRQGQWHDAMLPPRRRRVVIEPADSMNGLLFRADSLYEISRGIIAKARPFVHALSLLSYDVYAAPPAETAKRLTDLGFDLGQVRIATWQDRPTYVVGAPDGDRTTNQFWIDRDSLYLVRLIERRGDHDDHPGRPPLVQETWLEGQARVGGWWVPAEFSYFHNGRRFLHERVITRQPSAALDARVFELPWRRPE
jgi:hypothetical protein